MGGVRMWTSEFPALLTFCTLLTGGKRGAAPTQAPEMT